MTEPHSNASISARPASRYFFSYSKVVEQKSMTRHQEYEVKKSDK
jgi:hypothetical protein